MASDQAVLDQIGGSWAIQHGSPYSSRQFFVANLRHLITLLRREQALIAATGNTSRTITGDIKLIDITLNRTHSVPAKIVLGANAASGAAKGQDAVINDNVSGKILIAIAGLGAPAVGVTSDGGHAMCIGDSECLIIAVGGHGASPRNPPALAWGANGTDGGNGGYGLAGGRGVGNVIYGVGGNGAPGSPGQRGSPATTFMGYTIFAAGTPGTNGADGDGGIAMSVGGDATDYYAAGGRAAGPTNPFPGATSPGAAGTAGLGTVIHGPNDVRIIGCTNGDGTPGAVMQR